MGINAEYCPNLALRSFDQFEQGERKKEECVPKELREGEAYDFLKCGQRLYWFSNDEFWKNGQMPLCITSGDQKLSRPIASIKMIEVTHFLVGDKIWTRGKYKVIEIFKDNNIHFEGMKRV
ncbi:hypothetical protein CO057_02710 [Candidatus Uhrbacteria bacterium CG_4_9_14_0_2_um_filter_41_50]|uniref:Uncharacterized protein n=1 Tax=Candidatus Uhrbacteria bacterium CG_4_9_14_0_2_um_filter_41_50 TaxID=1975031 RepID=A0A2M8EP06_9BACT|nr:MAG: hypothetical protein COY24_00815 [Candidatus Uhrbacteria bacterium CG_4_10_14_0_2_um_filter_41_21]PJB84578.1 MAG: hypothetical protein CO086_02990 [Candidatus Uhrbacteria bacterium CG_4_9_14_0_8_um_filter_41_16]PJC24482.1 MAG: hypothetical protein CO057_02710 [Candidatus Uhrbacteria bacterium CG_4_9_14_0_2_um_filter_41_50]PJE75432.1 MAG: hypothetical protein COV03_00285 [Candidatus Uhrbacteria bacterium CG10_big_fil_rev_8_21_14_0_10_41_26]